MATRSYTPPAFPLNRVQLAEAIRNDRGWTWTPNIDILTDGSLMYVTHMLITAADDAAINTVIGGYVFNDTYTLTDDTAPAGQVHVHDIGPHTHAGVDTLIRLGTARTSTSTTLADIASLTFAVGAVQEYVFTAHLIFQTDATTTGINLSVNGPASPGGLYVARWIPLTATTVDFTSIRAYDGGSPTPSVDAATTDMLAIIEGIFRNGTNAGTLALRFASEVGGATVTIQPGSTLRHQKLVS